MVFLNTLLFSLFSVTLALPVAKVPSAIKIPLHAKAKHPQPSHATSVTLFDSAVEFYATIQVGTPPQDFNVIVDTGSTLLWLQGEECSASDCPSARYFHSNSSTAITTDYILNASYAGGNGAFGKFYQDTVSLAGLTFPHQLVGSSTTNGSLPQTYKQHLPQGIMGLSFAQNITSSDSTKHAYSSFVFELAKNNLIPKPIFSYALGPADIVEDGGELVLGGVNPEKYTGDIHYVPVAPTKFGNYTRYADWQAFTQDLSIYRSNNKSEAADVFFTNSSATYYAIMDTGTTFSYFNSELADALYKGVTGLAPPKNTTNNVAEEFWKIDCSFQNSTDFIQLGLTHNKDGTAEETPLKLRAPVSSFILPVDTETCFWTILSQGQLRGLDETQILLGQNFLKNFYVVNDMATPSMGFAPSVDYAGQVVL